MEIQDVLGLPLEKGKKILKEQKIRTIISETLPQKKNMDELLKKDLKNPYILRIREVSSNCVEVLVSYF